jgi:hypothetical protein
MNVFTLVLALAVFSGSPNTGAVSSGLQTYCPAENGQSHRLALNLANAPSYSASRSRLGIAATMSVAVLTDAADGAKCQQMLSYATQQAQAVGGSLSGTTTVFYRAGAYYFAIVTKSPPPAQTPPNGYLHVRTGFTLVHVFDSSLRPLGGAAL